jgi:hypothetical protein
MKAYGESERIGPVIISLSNRWDMPGSRPGRCTPGERATQYPLNRGGWMNGWTPEAFWRLWINEKSLGFAGNRATFCVLSVHSLVVIQSVLWLQMLLCTQKYDLECLLPPSPAHPVPDMPVKSEVSPRKEQSTVFIWSPSGMTL